MSLLGRHDRYVVISGPTAVARIALPPVGALTIGSDPAAGISVDQPGIARIHGQLYLDHGIGLEAREDGIEVVTGPRRARRTLAPGETAELELGDVAFVGQAELSFVALPATKARGRLSDRTTFARVLARQAADPTSSQRILARLCFSGGPSLEQAGTLLEAQLLPGSLATPLEVAGTADFAVLWGDVTQEEAVRVIQRLAGEAAAQKAELRAGMVHVGEAEVGQLAALAEARLAPVATLDVSRRIWVSDDPSMRRVMELIDRAAEATAHVLLLGETGTGKDLFAQMIHDRSPRAARPFVRIGCVELSEMLVEHGPGALLARARSGTVHLDEVLALSARAQLALGYLLDDVAGGGREARFIASSNQDLSSAVTRGEFRKDLYFRLDQLAITLPPLRERATDVVPLAELFLEQRAAALSKSPPRLTEAAKEKLIRHSWPGNVRELRNVIERALALATGNTIGAEQIGVQGPGSEATLPPDEEVVAPVVEGGPRLSLRDEIAALEKRRIIEAMRAFPTQREAAESLNMPMRTFLNRLDALGIPRARGGGTGQRSKDDEEE